MSYDNNMRGALFANGDRQNDKSPDYRGKCEIGGKPYFIAGWKKKDKHGSGYLSISFEEPRNEGQPRQQRESFQQRHERKQESYDERVNENARQSREENDDIPF